jgi:hypothetical protein
LSGFSNRLLFAGQLNPAKGEYRVVEHVVLPYISMVLLMLMILPAVFPVAV